MVVGSFAIFQKDLPEFAKVLKSLSLSRPNPCAVSTEDVRKGRNPFPRITMVIVIKAPGGNALSIEEQKVLITSLKGPDAIGTIKIFGVSDASIAALLSSRREKFRPPPGFTFTTSRVLYDHLRNEWHRGFREVDGKDYIELGVWKLRMAQTAQTRLNFALARQRYEALISFISTAYEHNPYSTKFIGNKLNYLTFESGFHIVQCCIKQGD